MLTIFVVSDSTGETAERVVRSALVQFEGANPKIVRRGQVRTPQQVRDVKGRKEGRLVTVLRFDSARARLKKKKSAREEKRRKKGGSSLLGLATGAWGMETLLLGN